MIHETMLRVSLHPRRDLAFPRRSPSARSSVSALRNPRIGRERRQMVDFDQLFQMRWGGFRGAPACGLAAGAHFGGPGLTSKSGGDRFSSSRSSVSALRNPRSGLERRRRVDFDQLFQMSWGPVLWGFPVCWLQEATLEVQVSRGNVARIASPRRAPAIRRVPGAIGEGFPDLHFSKRSPS